MQRWYFDSAENKLIGDGRIVQITPRAAAVLDCLMRHKGQTVGKAEILAQVWPGLHVTEDLIREYVFDLRAALGDDARKPRFIETLRGRGFRLIGDVRAADPAASDQGLETGAPDAPKPTIAVLRPVDLAARNQPSVMAERLAEAMISGLASHRDIEVVSRQSSFAIGRDCDLRDAAARLDARYLLESVIEATAGGLRGTFHLIEGLTGRHVWAQRLRAEGNAEATETLATTLVNMLAGWQGELHLAELRLALRKPVGSLSAFEHFIRGCDLELKFDAASLQRSIEHLERALELDPSFARAWVARAIMQQWAYDADADKDARLLEASAAAMAKAHLLDPRDPLTLSLIALQHARGGDLAGARDALDRARRECEADADACICIATAICVLEGDFPQAEAMLETACRINPVAPGWYRFVEARVRFYFGQYDRAIAASVSGPQRVSAILYRLLSQVMLDQVEAAAISWRELQAAYPGFDFSFYANYFPIASPAARARYDAAVQRFEALRTDGVIQD